MFVYVHGRFVGGAHATMIVIAPFIIPDAPDPAMARPIMNIGELMETAHTKEPSSKIARNERNVYYHPMLKPRLQLQITR